MPCRLVTAASRWTLPGEEPLALATVVCAAVIWLMTSDNVESTTDNRDVAELAVCV